MEPDVHISRSISDVSSLSTASVLSFYTIRVTALFVQDPQLDVFALAEGVRGVANNRKQLFNAQRTRRPRLSESCARLVPSGGGGGAQALSNNSE